MFMAGNEDIPINNGEVLNISQIVRAGCHWLQALFINTKTAVSMQRTLKR